MEWSRNGSCPPTEAACPRRCAQVPQFHEDDGRPILGCPLARVESWAVQLLELFPHYQQGFLYAEGGVTDQPYLYVWAMNVIGSEISKIEQEHAERERLKSEAERRRQGWR